MADVTGTEFGYNDNPAFGGYTEANWDKGAWGDDISDQTTQGVALPVAVLREHFGHEDAGHNALVEVTNNDTGQKTVARIMDKGPSAAGAGIDMMYATARAVGAPYNSTSNISYRILGKDETGGSQTGTQTDSSQTGGDEPGAEQYTPHTEEEYAKEYDDPSLQNQDQFGNQRPQTDFGQPNEQTEKPTDILGPDFMLQQIRQQHPEYGHATNDELIGAFQKRYQTPLTQLRALFPQYDDKISDDKAFGDAVRKKFYPDLSEKDFNDRLNPPTGVVASVKNYVEGFTDRVLWKNTVQAWHAAIGAVTKFPEVFDESMESLYKQGWIGEAMKPPTQEDPGFRQQLKNLYEYGQRQTKKAQNVNVPKPQGIVENINAVIGQGLGSTPSTAMAFMPGIGPEASLALGTVYSGVTAANDAHDAKQDSALAQGWLAGGVTAAQHILLNTSRGRILTGVFNAVIGASGEQAQKFLSGDTDNDIDKTLATGTVNFLIGVMGARGKEKLPVAAREEFEKAVTARDAGDTEKAKQLLDKSQLFLKDSDRNELGQLLLKWRDDVIPMGNSDPPKALPANTRPALPAPRVPRETPTAPSGPAIQRPYRTKEELKVDPYTPDQDSQLSLTARKPPEATTGTKAADTFTQNMTDQFFYSGIPVGHIGDFLIENLPKVREAASKATKPATDIWHKAWDAENLSPKHELAAAVIAEQNAQFATDRTRLVNTMVRKMKLEDTLRFAEDADARRAYWRTVPEGKLKKMFEDYEAKKDSGNKIANRLFRIGDQVFAATTHMDEYNGIHYPVKDSYIPYLLKNPKDITRLENLIKRKKWGDPSFMKPRELDSIKQLHAYGMEFKTYNFEDIQQARLEASLRARARVQGLEKMEKVGLAINKEDFDKLPEETQDRLTEEGAVDWRSPNGDHFMVDPAANHMMHLAWDPSIINDTNLAGKVVSGLNAIKQRTAGIRLGLSLWHAVHGLDINAANVLATAQGRFLDKGFDGKSLLEALKDTITGDSAKDIVTAGFHGAIKAVKGEDRMLDFYNGKLSFEDLSEDERWQYRYQKMGGLSPVVSHERETQILQFINKSVPVAGRAKDQVMDLGYKILTGGPFQPWLFKKVYPSMKMAAFNAEAHSLLDAHPELMNPRAEAKLQVELRRIGKNVDSRFGEMDYNNLFWPKATKILGQAFMLSMGWTLGFYRIYAGGIHSLMNNVSHMDELIKTYREEGLRPAARRVATNKVLYMANYTALTAIKNLVISQVIGGGVTGIMDALYPRVGTDEKGQPKRLKTPFFLGEWGAIYELYQRSGGVGAAVDYFRNKAQPALSTLSEIAQNKDYRGTQIHNPHDPLINQIGETSAFLFRELLPFSAEAAVNPKPGATWTDRLLPFFGFPPAPAWTARSDTANKIINAYIAMQGDRTMTQKTRDQIDARSAYREALVNKDQGSADAALKHMHELGMTSQSIHNVEKTRDVTTDERLLSHLDEDTQEDLLKGMKPDEREKYLKFASPAVRKKLQHAALKGSSSDAGQMPRHSTTGHPAPRTPEEALALAPGTRFMDPNGKLRMVPQNA